MEMLHGEKGPLVGVLADDQRKSDLIDLLRSWRDELVGVRFVATRETGNLIRSRVDVDVDLVEAGARGGAYQIAALVVEGEVDAVIALYQPTLRNEEDAGMVAIRRVCEIHDVAFASNRATTCAVLRFLRSPYSSESPCRAISCGDMRYTQAISEQRERLHDG